MTITVSAAVTTSEVLPCVRRFVSFAFATSLALAAPVHAQSSYTLYELLEPGSAKFKITYDVTSARAGTEYYLNAIRAGSIATDESVWDLSTGEELFFEVITGAQAKAEGLAGARTPDDNEYIKVHLGRTIPEEGEARLRIIKTYEDPESYFVDGETVVFDRGLGIRANAVVLPRGYELVSSRTPGIAGTTEDGRIKVSLLNDRDDQLAVRVVGRRTSTPAAPVGGSHRAEQTREITYWLLDPATHQFRISHDFTVDTPGQQYVHSFVRAGSIVSDAEVWDIDAGAKLETYNVTGADVNALGFYRARYDDDQVVVQSELLAEVGEGESTRVRVIETYTDEERYYMDGEELVWDRSLGRPYNTVKLPAGWMLTGVSVPAIVSEDNDGLVSLRFINIRNDSIQVVIRAQRRQ